MSPRRPGRLPSALGLICLALSFAQRPGLTFTDTRIDLSVNPSLFLARATQVFSGTGDLGHVQSGQFVGYLFPMGPWYALMHLLGVPSWIAERLWLAALLFAAAYGVVRLLDALLGSQRGAAHAVASTVYAISPFTVVYLSRASASLLPLAVLPWLMLAVLRGVYEPRSWRWPAAVGLLVALSGGGINAAQVAWIALAPVGLLIWEATVGRAGSRSAMQFAWRAAVCSLLGSAWWLIPAILQGAYGGNFLAFTEQPQTIWATTSASESLRLLGYWPMYLGTGYGTVAPVMQIGQTYLFESVVIVASFLVPGAALLGLRSTGRWFYAPFFALLACATVTLMAAGFPNGTAFSHVLSLAYTHLQSARFLRTSYKAAPMLALSVGVLSGLTARHLLEHVRKRALHAPAAFVTSVAERAPTPGLRRSIMGAGRYITLPGIGLVLLACAPVAWAWPLFTGQAIDRPLAYNKVPAAWPNALAASGRNAGQDARTLILPGELYGDYAWGRTWDSVAPALARSPVTIRQAVRYADPRAAELLDTVDDQVQQGRLVPGELPPILRLLGVGQVLVTTDALNSQSGASDPAGVAQSLKGQPEFVRPLATYGPRQTFLPVLGRDGPARRLPEIRRYGIQNPLGLVHVDAAGPGTILDGGPGGIVELAADGQLRPGRPLFYAGDLDRGQVAYLLRTGARLVFSDSNRRGVVSATYVRQDIGPTLTATAPIPSGAASWDLFPRAGRLGETVASYGGLTDLVSPQPSGAQLFPAFAPAAALDGNPATSWLPDPALPPSQLWMELRLAVPRAMGSITVVPKPVVGLSPLWVGISVNGGPERDVLLRPGPNSVSIDAPEVQTLRFRLLDVTASQLFLGAGGLEQVSIPGLTPVPETLVLPKLLALTAHGMDTSHSEMVVALTRTSADFPTRVGTAQGVPLARSETTPADPELGIRRTVALPTTRRFSATGWATVSPAASDYAIDALTRSAPGWIISSSSRFEGVPISRASSAFDRARASSWVGDLVPRLKVNFAQNTSALPAAAAAELLGGVPGQPRSSWRGALQPPYPWLAIRGTRPVRLSTLRLLPGAARYASPATVQLVTDAGSSGLLRVAPGGLVRLPKPVSTRSLLIQIHSVHPATGQAGARLLRAVAISEVVSPFDPPPPRRSGPLETPCGALTIAGPDGILTVRVSGTIQQLDQNIPLRIAGCGRSSAIQLPAGQSTITAPAGAVFRPDHLLLDSPAPNPLPVSPIGTARVTGGLPANDVPRAAALGVSGSSGWLVLSESYSRGWRAFCAEPGRPQRSLGKPIPIDGFANGWPISSRCQRVSFQFAPQRAADVGYIISLASIPLVFALMLLSRRRRSPSRRAPYPDRAQDHLVRLSWLAALAVGTAATIVIGFLFAIPIGPLAVPIMRRGTNPRRLFTLGGGLLLLVPVAYLIRSAANPGGFDFNYAYDNLLGHWLAVGGICAIAGGSVLQLVSAIRRPAAPSLSPSDARHHAPAREPRAVAAPGPNP